jgi:hypothetical protein
MYHHTVKATHQQQGRQADLLRRNMVRQVRAAAPAHHCRNGIALFGRSLQRQCGGQSAISGFFIRAVCLLSSVMP